MSNEPYTYPDNFDPESEEDFGYFGPAASESADSRKKPPQPLSGGGVSALAKRPRKTTSPVEPRPRPSRPSRREPNTRSSTVRLPVELIEAVKAEHQATKVSLGGVIILAIESCVEDLPDLLSGGPVSKSGFSSAAMSPKVESEKRVFSFRLSYHDFQALDQLVEQVGAQSASQLISTALTTYFKDRHD